MTLRVDGDAKQLEHLHEVEPDTFKRVADAGRKAGATFHRFYASDTEILVIDEWPDEQSFHAFFASQHEIPKMMAEAGATGQPEIRFYRKLELGDDIG